MIYHDLLNQLNQDSFDLYYQYLIEENQKLNLTTITEKEDVYQKHFYDSLVITKLIDFKNQTVLDIGAGAGFPSIPIKLIVPSMNLTIVDGLNKRIDFLKRLCQKLEIDIHLIHGRAETLQKFNHYDVMMARAVAKLNILVEMAMPALKIGGYFVAFKSLHYQEELNEASSAIQLLGGVVDQIVTYDINETLKHVYIIIKKVKKTPKGYPRHFSKIKKKPL